MQYQRQFKIVINRSTPLMVSATFPETEPPNFVQRIQSIYNKAALPKCIGFAHQVNKDGTTTAPNRYLLTSKNGQQNIIGLRIKLNQDANLKLNEDKTDFDDPENKNVKALPKTLRGSILKMMQSSSIQDVAVYTIGRGSFYAVEIMKQSGEWRQSFHRSDGAKIDEEILWKALDQKLVPEPDFSV